MITWNETTEDRFDEMLGVLPPAASTNGYRAFLVGEPMSHRDGHPTFSAFTTKDGKRFESDDAVTFAEFKAEHPDASYDYLS